MADPKFAVTLDPLVPPRDSYARYAVTVDVPHGVNVRECLKESFEAAVKQICNVQEAYDEHIPGAETLPAHKDWNTVTACQSEDNKEKKSIYRTRVAVYDLARIVEELANELGKKDIAERADDVQKNIHELVSNGG